MTGKHRHGGGNRDAATQASDASDAEIGAGTGEPPPEGPRPDSATEDASQGGGFASDGPRGKVKAKPRSRPDHA
jgi:hypothetical protein